MHSVYNPGLLDRTDSNLPHIYRIMTPFFNGSETTYSAVKMLSSTPILHGVLPCTPTSLWARLLGVKADEVSPPNPMPGTKISPAPIGQAGAGMSVLPVISAMPHHRIPKRNGGMGSNKDCWFFLERKHVENSPVLRLHFDEGENSSKLVTHGVIEPSTHMEPADFTTALSATAGDWVCMNH